VDQQVKAFFAFLGAAILAGWMMAHFGQHHLGLEGSGTRPSTSSRLSTGTGYSSTDYGLWGPHAVAFFFIIMFVGGCAGSTSCGIKIFRFQVFFEAVRQHVCPGDVSAWRVPRALQRQADRRTGSSPR
jgi:trk system potassium uptake protein TrkH